MVNSKTENPTSTAPATVSVDKKAPSAGARVNAVCTEIKDLGIVATPFGDKPQIQVTFETVAVDEAGGTRTLIRKFNNYMLPDSNLTKEVGSWTGRDLVAEKQKGRVNLKSLVGKKAHLRLEPVLTNSGSTFDKIVEILPAE